MAHRNRLERLNAHEGEGALERAFAELDRFVDNVERHTPRAIERVASEALVDLANRVRVALTS